MLNVHDQIALCKLRNEAYRQHLAYTDGLHLWWGVRVGLISVDEVKSMLSYQFAVRKFGQP